MNEKKLIGIVQTGDPESDFFSIPVKELLEQLQAKIEGDRKSVV